MSIPTIGESVRVPEQPCPACASPLSAAAVAGGDEATPRPGDVSVCLYCDALLVYLPGLALRAATAAEVAGLDPGNADTVRVLQAASGMARRKHAH